MYAIAGAAPALGLAIAFWVLVGVRRPHPEGPFTAATAAAWYAHLMVLAGAVMSLVGGALAVKAAFGFANLEYSYPGPSEFYGPPGANVGPQSSRDDDLTLGITLLAVGVLVLVLHVLMIRLVARRPGGALMWISRGSLVLFTLFAGIVALVTTVMGVYDSIGYARGVGNHHFGEAVGMALFFLPAWIVTTWWLLRGGADQDRSIISPRARPGAIMG